MQEYHFGRGGAVRNEKSFFSRNVDPHFKMKFETKFILLSTSFWDTINSFLSTGINHISAARGFFCAEKKFQSHCSPVFIDNRTAHRALFICGPKRRTCRYAYSQDFGQCSKKSIWLFPFDNFMSNVFNRILYAMLDKNTQILFPNPKQSSCPLNLA